MGSLNNGNRINQNRKSIRNIGGFQTSSTDRVEGQGIRDIVQLGTTSNSFESQYSVVAISDIVKTTNNQLDSYRDRTSPTGSAVPVDGLSNPNPFSGGDPQSPLLLDIDGAGNDITDLGQVASDYVTANVGITSSGFLVSQGDSTFNGRIYLNDSVGTSGQVLQTRGTGADAQWYTIPAAFEYTAITSDGTLQVGKNNTNVGAVGEVIATLPTSASIGDIVMVTVGAAQSFKVKAPASTFIQTTQATSAEAGYFQSTRVASEMILTKISSTLWIAKCTGTWRIDKTTGAGFAYTPTEYTSFTPVCGWTGGAITITGYYQHVANEIKCRVLLSFTGDITGTELYIGVVPNFTIDPTYINYDSTYAHVGHMYYFDSGAGVYNYPMVYQGGQIFYIITSNAAGVTAFFTRGTPATPANGDRCTLVYSYPTI
jgi:hypothetical protein